MFCQNCGTQNNDGSLFCEKCGAKLEAPVVQAAPVAEAPAFEAAPVVQSTPVAPTAAAAAAPVAPKKPLNLKFNPFMLAVIGEAIVLVIAVVVLISTIVKANNYEKTASKFWNCMAAEKYAEAYKYLDIDEDNAFLTQEAFVSAMASQPYCEAEKVRVKKSKERSGKKAIYTISYKLDGSEDTLELELEKSKGGWKIDPAPFLTSNEITVSVPVDSTLYIDGNKISDKYVDSEDTYSATYKINSMFKGGHTYYAEKDVFGTKEEFTKDTYVYLGQLTVAKDKKEEVCKAAETIMTKTLETWVNGDSYSEVKDYYTDSSSSSYYTNETRFDNYADNFFAGSDDSWGYISGITAESIKDAKITITGVSTYSGDTTVSLRIKGTRNYTYQKYNSSKKYISKSGDSEEEFDIYLNLIYRDGEWLSDNIGSFSALTYSSIY